VELQRVVGGDSRACPRPVPDPQFRKLLETLPAAAYTCDPQGLITYYNSHAVDLWGRRPRLNDAVDRFCGSFKLFATDGTSIAHDECWMALALRNAPAPSRPGASRVRAAARGGRTDRPTPEVRISSFHEALQGNDVMIQVRAQATADFLHELLALSARSQKRGASGSGGNGMMAWHGGAPFRNVSVD
jgi:hypothetical protein